MPWLGASAIREEILEIASHVMAMLAVEYAADHTPNLSTKIIPTKIP